MARCEGIVKWFNENQGCGRIMLDGQDGQHVFVHFSAIKPNSTRFADGYRLLKKGQKVAFDLIETKASDSQRLRAENVEVLSDQGTTGCG